MSYLKNGLFFIRSPHPLGQAAGRLLARLRAVHQGSRNQHEASRVDSAAELASLVPKLTVIAALAVVLALSIGCGSKSRSTPPANKAPTVVNPGSQTGVVGQPASLPVAASDADGDVLQFSSSGLPTGLLINPGTGQITGIYGATGNFAVVVTVTDGKASVRVEFSWNVTAPNTPPIANAQSVFVGFNTSRAIVLAGFDLENDPLTFNVVANPTSGSLSGAPPNLTYTPSPEFSGTDSLRFTVWDGKQTSDPAEVTIRVRPEGVRSPNILFVVMDDVGMDTSSQMHPGLIEELTAQYGPQGHNHPF